MTRLPLALVLLAGCAAEPPPPAEPVAAVSAPASAPAPAPPRPVSAEGLVLFGVSGTPGALAAVIGAASGAQRVVPLGEEVRPGLRVAGIAPDHAVLESAGWRTRLELNGFASAAPAPAAPIGAPPAPAVEMDAIALRTGLAARRSSGRIDGFALRRTARLAPLLRAGLRQGDVIVAVNGQPFDSEEKLLELPREIAGSYTAEFEFEREGRRMKATLPVNPRPQS